jgi:hypothetical protein
VINLDSDEDGEDDDIVFLGRMNEKDQKVTNAHRKNNIRDHERAKQKNSSSVTSSNDQEPTESKLIYTSHSFNRDSSLDLHKSSHSSDYNNNRNNNTSNNSSNLGFKRTYFESQESDQFHVPKIQCEICNLMVSLSALDYHMRRHETSGDVLKHDQDKDYNQSVQEDILKNTLKEENERMEEKRRKDIEDEINLGEIVKASKEAYERQEMERFKADLLPEPLLEPSIRIRYTYIYVYFYVCIFIYLYMCICISMYNCVSVNVISIRNFRIALPSTG